MNSNNTKQRVKAQGMDYPIQFVKFERREGQVIPVLLSYENDGTRYWLARIQELRWTSPILRNAERSEAEHPKMVNGEFCNTRMELYNSWALHFPSYEFEPFLPLDEAAWDHHNANLGKTHGLAEFDNLVDVDTGTNFEAA